MKVVILLALVASAAALQETEYRFMFEAWRAEHGKTYESGNDAEARYAVFKENIDFIAEHNAGDHSYTVGMNQFGDMTNTEYKVMVQRCGPQVSGGVPGSLRGEKLTADPPAAVDWTTKGAVTPVKNQEQCGSCWAFSTTGSTEGITFISSGTLPSLSEQQLVDCGTKEGSHGCEGGLMDYGFQYIIDNGGLCDEKDYPYIAVDSACKAASCTPVATIKAFTDVTAQDEDQLLVAAAQQPVSVAIEADGIGFQFYSGGVYDDIFCGTKLDHGVLIAGYGTDSGKMYWKVKNSWGATWGEAGYIRMARKGGKTKGMCGIAMQPSYPTV
jgi:KDEL-tailed cysteine endopeptidase